MDQDEFTTMAAGLRGAAITMDDFLALVGVSPVIRAKLDPYNLQTVSLPAEPGDPLLAIDGAGEVLRLHVMVDGVPRQHVTRALSWARSNGFEIHRGDIRYVFVDDTSEQRLGREVQAMALPVLRHGERRMHGRARVIASMQAMADSIPSLYLPAPVVEIRASGELARGEDPVRYVDIFVKTDPAVLSNDEQAMKVALNPHHPTAWHVFFRASMVSAPDVLAWSPRCPDVKANLGVLPPR